MPVVGSEAFWWSIAAVGAGGLGVGVGLVVGAYAVRVVRRIIKDDDSPGGPL